MGIKVINGFPRVQSLINNGAFTSDHYAANLALSDTIVHALEHFLSLEKVKGFSGKYDSLINFPVGSPDQNDRNMNWASMCAELGAIFLLSQTLNAHIVGFDQVSPYATRPRSNCDILVIVNGHLVFVEVKRKASQDKQDLPETLEKVLRELKLPCNICGVEMLNRDYKCHNLNTEALKIKEYADKASHLTEVPLPYTTDDFRIYFELGPNTPRINNFFDPAFSGDLATHLFGPSPKTSMIPMVDRARDKGANYLFCRTPRWENWPAVIETCFSGVSYSNGRTYFTDDVRMYGLYGIVLFSHYDDFCIVNNVFEGEGAWVLA